MMIGEPRARRTLGHVPGPECGRAGKLARRGQPGASAPPARHEDRVSPSLLEFQKMRDQIAATPDVREELVRELKRQIASGHYQIDGARIADKILNET